MPSNPARLYEEDFVRWTEQQAAALRDAARLGTNLPLDWQNLAEEIDSLGRSQRRELRSRIDVIIEHLIKLDASPAADPRRGWIETVGRERSEIELLLDDSPSLRNAVPMMVAAEISRAKRRLGRLLERHGEAAAEVITSIAAAQFTAEQVLGDWFPGDPPPPAGGERDRAAPAP